jgi:hypothetical protein
MAKVLMQTFLNITFIRAFPLLPLYVCVTIISCEATMLRISHYVVFLSAPLLVFHPSPLPLFLQQPFIPKMHPPATLQAGKKGLLYGA